MVHLFVLRASNIVLGFAEMCCSIKKTAVPCPQRWLRAAIVVWVRVSCTWGDAFSVGRLTVFPAQRELFRVFTDNLRLKSGERKVSQIMDYMVNACVNAAARFQRAAWIGTIFRTCRRSQEESVTRSNP